MNNARVSDVIAAALTRHIDAVFGLMGNGNAWLCHALEESGHGIVAVRHEVAAVAAADAYHRTSGRIAAATTTYGPGFTNTVTALAEAAIARTPLIYVVGDAPTTGRRPWDIDQVGIAAAVGAPTFTVSPEDAGAVTVTAIAHALTERLPVVLAVPYDVGAVPVTDSGRKIPELPAMPAAAPLADPAHIAGLLLAARFPLILAGRGAKSAAADLRTLAAALRADVATSAPARGMFTDGRGYRDLGVCGGFASEFSARQIRESDVVLVVGAGLNQFTTAFGEAFDPLATVIQIDLADEPTNTRVDEFRRADAALAVSQILTELGDVARPDVDKPGGDARPQGDALAPDGRLDPRSLMVRLNRVLPADKLVASDGGHFIGWANMYLDLSEADSINLLGTAFQSIGLGFSAGVGVAAAAGERTTVLVTGDGGGLMGFADAESFLRVAHRGVVIVFNDAAYGAEIHQYATKGLREEPMLIPDINFAALFQALGATSKVIRELDDLEDFEEWIASSATGTYVLDCRVSPQIVAPYMREIAGI